MSNDKKNKMVRAFHFNDSPVRTIVRENEKWREWFVASDVLNVLGINSNVTRALDGHEGRDDPGLPDEDKGVDTVHTPGGVQQVRVVNEPGLYRLVFKSRKKAARAFQHWVVHEVLPELRRKGVYALNTDGKDYNTALALLPGMISGARQSAEAMGFPYDNAELVIRVIEQWQDRYGHRVPFALSMLLERANEDPTLPEAQDDEEYMPLAKLCSYFGIWSVSGNPHTTYMARLLKNAGIHKDARFGQASIRTIKDNQGHNKAVMDWLYASRRVEAYLEQRYGTEAWMWPTYLPGVLDNKRRRHAVRYTGIKLKAYWVRMKAPFEYTRLKDEDIDHLEFKGSKGRVNLGMDTVSDGNILVFLLNEETLHIGFSAIWEYLSETDQIMCREFCKNYNIDDRTGEPLPPQLVRGGRSK